MTGRIALVVSLAVLTAPHPCAAQAYKCQVGGKWTYQQSPCVQAPSKAVDVRPASSGIAGVKEAPPTTFDPKICRFAYFSYGDELGKTLAAAAKQECLDTHGQLGPAYVRWKDHHQMVSAKRNAAVQNQQQQQQMKDAVREGIRDCRITGGC